MRKLGIKAPKILVIFPLALTGPSCGSLHFMIFCNEDAVLQRKQVKENIEGNLAAIKIEL